MFIKKIQKGISIIIPVLNEAGNISPLIKRIDKSMRSLGYDYEVIIIDDNSTDDTIGEIEKNQKTYPIYYYTKTGKRGKAQSLIEGFQYTKYELFCMIDSDLQYPPEAIPEMVRKIDKGADVVIANRAEAETNIIRRYASRVFNGLFCKILHGLDVDVQSGLKVFRKEIIERITLFPFPWTFDLEFLLEAQAAGYKIDSVDIVFAKRHSGKSKLNIFFASLQIGLSALLLKFKPQNIIIFNEARARKEGKGFHFKKVKFIHFSDLSLADTAVKTLLTHQVIGIVLFILLFIFGLFINWTATITILISIITVVYFVDLLFNFVLIYRSFTKNPEIKITSKQIEKVKEWPQYTIFCPLYKEWDVVPQFVNAIDKLDYPKDKLQVQLLLEEDDTETRNRVREYDLPDYFEVVVVPDTLPKTKPKACNYGLRTATGKYAVIFDAEDIPDVLQLKKAVVAFEQSDDSIVCIQAKLNYYNHNQNLLTRLFTAEYTLWFDLILTGLQSLKAPIPLGGTSNHFRVDKLKEVKGWDSFNVTEDCELGMRLAKHGYQTAIIDSITLEEANSDFLNWINQRSRWIKGYIQTYLVHMRYPHKFLQRKSRIHFFTFQLVVGGKIIALFINPIMWLMTILYFTMRATVGLTIEKFFTGPIFFMGVFSLIFGNFLYMYYYMVGCAKRKQYDLIKYVYLVPFYWIAMSVAAWKGTVQLFFNPHYWPKTKHGLHIKKYDITYQLPKEGLETNYLYHVFNSLLSKGKGTFNSARLLIGAGIIALSIPSSIIAYHLVQNNYIFPLASPIIVLFVVLMLYYFLKFFVAISLNIADFLNLFSHLPREIDKNKNYLNILIFNWRDMNHVWSGGAEVYIHEIAKRLVKNRHNVTVFCGNDNRCKRYEVIDGVNIIRRGGFYTVYIWAFLYYILKLRNKFDIIFDSENGVPFFTPLYVKRPIIGLVHHVHQEVFRANLPKPLSTIACFLEATVMPIVYRNVQMITVSESSKKDMEKIGLGKRKPIETIHPGIDLVQYKPGVKTSYPTVLYLGRLKAYKSVDVLLRAVKRLITTIPDIQITIAGFGESRGDLIKLAKELQIMEYIRFTGKVTDVEKIRLLQESWIFVQPSFMEGWGITAIEAQASGTPVVASNVGGLKDSVNNPHSGFLVKYGSVKEFSSKIEKILTDKELRKQFEKNSIKWAQNFSWEKSIVKIESLIIHKSI